MRTDFFKKIVTGELFKYAGLDRTKIEQVNHTVEENDWVYDVITFRRITDIEGYTISIDDMYDDYIKYQNLQKVFDIYSDMINDRLKPKFNTSEIISKEYILNHVVLKLINRDNNSELLKEHPYREFLDLAMVYSVVMSDEPLGSFLVTLDMLAELKLDENTLFQAASKNTEISCRISSLTPKYEKLLDRKGDPFLVSGKEYPFYIVTNMNSTYGAISIMYSSMTERIRKLINCDEFLIIPANVHECICAPYNPEYPVEYLQADLMEMNYSITESTERLSNSVYIFKNGKISILSSFKKEQGRPEEVSK